VVCKRLRREWAMTKSQPRRARRYALGLTIRYREKGHVEWHVGTTRNISESGVLFLTGCVPHENATIEMRILMPLAIGNERAAEVVGQGTVVRRALPNRLGVMPAVAVAFVDYRFVRGKATRSRKSERKSSSAVKPLISES
jgi:hypothetical protein